MTKQQQIKDTLTKTGLPFKEIDCYGRQIVVTSWCRESSMKWAQLLAKFATVRGITESVDYAKENKNTVLRPTTVKVWRTFAAIL